MAEEASTTKSKNKESAVLTDGSLAVLAREVGAEKLNGLILSMYLNIPNTTIVKFANEASDVGLISASDNMRAETTQRLLLHWKRLRVNSKDKEKVKDLERALKEIGRGDIAEVIIDKHANHAELTADAFSS
ncbi:hypothetical protein CHS0354_005518 [Potamilus streckersoni]|uniref:Death domain-containing protein n=1 Tax=Potamilus streckersoni TaxID=2493646 RepID=A0AAE0VLE2_9BIVA|nr:hypothetical protein CHS0354_005518 [Potamilus streckersoni]